MRRKWQIRPQGKFGQHCTPQSRTSRGENVCKAIIEQRAFELRSPRITHAVPNGSVILTTSSPRLELRTIRKRMYKSTRKDASKILGGPGVANDGTQPEFRTVVLRVLANVQVQGVRTQQLVYGRMQTQHSMAKFSTKPYIFHESPSPPNSFSSRIESSTSTFSLYSGAPRNSVRHWRARSIIFAAT